MRLMQCSAALRSAALAHSMQWRGLQPHSCRMFSVRGHLLPGRCITSLLWVHVATTPQPPQIPSPSAIRRQGSPSIPVTSLQIPTYQSQCFVSTPNYHIPAGRQQHMHSAHEHLSPLPTSVPTRPRPESTLLSLAPSLLQAGQGTRNRFMSQLILTHRSSDVATQMKALGAANTPAVRKSAARSNIPFAKVRPAVDSTAASLWTAAAAAAAPESLSISSSAHNTCASDTWPPPPLPR
jgi:hypothetical protein